jgi:tRNA(Ile)-lysidine synthase TilS/MesJ
MDLPLYIRKVDEIQRDVKCDRSFYEKITKEIRFNAYKFLDRPVVLGHNKDDCLENIFSNIKKCQNYDNLNGMLSISYQKEVTLVRPMLSISKKQIIEIANQCNIPYLEDSTPSWSERGKMRDELIPFLNNFDSRIISGLIKLSTHCSKITETYHGILEESTSINLDSDKNIEIYFCKEYCDLEFWKQTFFHCKKEYDIGSVTNKSIENLICILKSTNPKRKTVLNQSYFAQVIDKDTEYHRGGGIIRTRLVLSKHK